ncbi:3-dehydroquinate synthase [Candidatus Pacearchaeota archaeon]|nr:3-dehydroquinate synthase [Candidatus Pacearchaeota archaeon]
MANPDLIKFILEARKRGFTDIKITESPLSNGWSMHEIHSGYEALRQHHFKKGITIWLDKEIIDLLEKRAKRNLMTLPEQIEEIVRRSIASQRPTQQKEKLDDMLVGLFSRKYRKN